MTDRIAAVAAYTAALMNRDEDSAGRVAPVLADDIVV
jgi:hypothetical protein